jgi:hypothetical protein
MNDFSCIYTTLAATATDNAETRNCFVNMSAPWWSIPPYAPANVPATVVIQEPFTEERLRQIVAEEVAKALAPCKEEKCLNCRHS